jgi:hypothetical protein
MEVEEMNPSWRMFAEKVAAGANATEAYLDSGFQSTDRKNAQRSAWRLRQKPEVAAYIKELREAAAAKGKADITLTIEEKLAFLTRAIRTGAGGIQGENELCQSFRQFSDGSISIRTPCKLKAIKLHSELSGDLDDRKAQRQTLPAKDTLQELFDAIRRGS